MGLGSKLEGEQDNLERNWGRQESWKQGGKSHFKQKQRSLSFWVQVWLPHVSCVSFWIILLDFPTDFLDSTGCLKVYIWCYAYLWNSKTVFIYLFIFHASSLILSGSIYEQLVCSFVLWMFWIWTLIPWT